jgi:nucleoside-diphosphate-sugar epimerase
LKIAVVGASGFVGSRLVEMLHLGEEHSVRPVVRSVGSLSRVCRFALDYAIAEVSNEEALVKAFQGVDVVVHTALGNPDEIERGVETVYRACCRSGVKRMVYLSSASVHGQAPAAGTDESTPLSDKQSIDYNNWKVRAEWRLARIRAKGNVETVILRPGIVYGPRDRWMTHMADQLLADRAFVLNEGSGICNSIYVDNLIHAISLAFTAPGVDREAFLVGDAEVVTWMDMFACVADFLGVSRHSIRPGRPRQEQRSLMNKLDAVRSLAFSQRVLKLAPARGKRAGKAMIAGWFQQPITTNWDDTVKEDNSVPLEMALLYQCEYKLPYDKAAAMLNYQPAVTFEEACRRSLGALEFMGYTKRLSA